MKEQYSIIQGAKIAYIEKQDQSDRVVVFLHGWGSNYKVFTSLYSDLSSFVALDFPGFGNSSDLQEAWGLSQYVSVTKEFLEKKFSNKKLIFVSHSFGGRVLVKMLSMGGLKDIEIQKVLCIGVPFVREYGFREKIITQISQGAKLFLHFFPKDTQEAFQEAWYHFISGDDYRNLSSDVLRNTFRNIVEEEIFQYVDALGKYDTCLLWGDKDNMASLDGAREVSQKINAKLYVFKNGTHFPFLSPTQEEFKRVFDEIVKA